MKNKKIIKKTSEDPIEQEQLETAQEIFAILYDKAEILSPDRVLRVCINALSSKKGKYITSEEYLWNLCSMTKAEWNYFKRSATTKFNKIEKLITINKANAFLRTVEALEHSNHPQCILTRLKMYSDETRQLLNNIEQQEDIKPDISRLNSILDTLLGSQDDKKTE